MHVVQLTGIVRVVGYKGEDGTRHRSKYDHEC